MTPKNLFGLANRIAGLVVALYGADWLARFCLGQLGYFKLSSTDIGYYLFMGIGNLVVGAYFLRGAPHFVRYAYPDEEGPAEIDEDETQSQDPDESAGN